MLPSQGELGAVSSPVVIWKRYVEKYYIFSAHLAEFLSVAIGLESYCLKKKKKLFAISSIHLMTERSLKCMFALSNFGNCKEFIYVI